MLSAFTSPVLEEVAAVGASVSSASDPSSDYGPVGSDPASDSWEADLEEELHSSPSGLASVDPEDGRIPCLGVAHWVGAASQEADPWAGALPASLDLVDHPAASLWVASVATSAFACSAASAHRHPEASPFLDPPPVNPSRLSSGPCASDSA